MYFRNSSLGSHSAPDRDPEMLCKSDHLIPCFRDKCSLTTDDDGPFCRSNEFQCPVYLCKIRNGTVGRPFRHARIGEYVINLGFLNIYIHWDPDMYGSGTSAQRNTESPSYKEGDVLCFAYQNAFLRYRAVEPVLVKARKHISFVVVERDI